MLLLLALLVQQPIAGTLDTGADQEIQHVQSDELFELHYSFPATLVSMPLLRAELARAMERHRARGTRLARGARAQAQREDFPFSPHLFSAVWRLEGRTPQLASLSAQTSAWSGGGHSDEGFDVLLWDLVRNRRIQAYELFPAATLAPRFCAAYPDALRNHLGEAAPAPDDARWTCPAIGGRPIAPADRDGNGRFDTLRVFMEVNYFEAEGYSVDVAIEPSDLERLPAGFLPAFEITGG